MIKVLEKPPVYFLDDLEFPNPYEEFEEGFVGGSPDLSVERLLTGYSQGFFPWYKDEEEGLFHWFLLDKRLFLYVDDVVITKKMAQKLRSPKWEVRYNTNFDAVIRNCATIKRKHEDETWISEEFIEAYTKLYKAGYVLSVETYFEGELVGGFYGVAIGNYFSGESMFALKSDASKLALIDFCLMGRDNGIEFIDCQTITEHLLRMGGKIVEKEEYLDKIKEKVFIKR